MNLYVAFVVKQLALLGAALAGCAWFGAPWWVLFVALLVVAFGEIRVRTGERESGDFVAGAKAAFRYASSEADRLSGDGYVSIHANASSALVSFSGRCIGWSEVVPRELLPAADDE